MSTKYLRKGRWMSLAEAQAEGQEVAPEAPVSELEAEAKPKGKKKK